MPFCYRRKSDLIYKILLIFKLIITAIVSNTVIGIRNYIHNLEIDYVYVTAIVDFIRFSKNY